MAQETAALSRSAAISFNWIIDKKNDLVWYIGSAMGGWGYAGLVLLAVAVLANPLKDAFGVITVGGLQIPLTLQLLVYSSWAFLLDAPHVWATLARTFLDPEERRLRRREFMISWLWFLVSPACILAPYLYNLIAPESARLPAGLLGLGALLFTVFFRLWAYYHVVRQHWGFYVLYQRKNADTDPVSNRVDFWFFNLALYAPLVMFLTGPLFDKTPGIPDVGLNRMIIGGFNISTAIHTLAWTVFSVAVVSYLAYQIRLWRQGQTLNGPKLLFLLSIVPLHLAVFNHPWLAALMVPIVTIGHNLQYHRIVWMFGQNKYQRPESRSRFKAASTVFSHAGIYFATGLLFTFALYRGPWIDWIKGAVGMGLNDSFLLGVGMMAGLADPTTMNLGQQLFGGFLVGWAMQHYYLDSKIWRVRSDRTVAQQLRVE